MVESQREQRRIRCSGCQEHIWLRYSYTDKKPLTAVGIDCPRDHCQKLNRVYMPETATGIEVGTEPSHSPDVTGEPTSGEAAESASVADPGTHSSRPAPEEGLEGRAPDGKAPDTKAPEGKAPRKNVYWRPPRF